MKILIFWYLYCLKYDANLKFIWFEYLRRGTMRKLIGNQSIPSCLMIINKSTICLRPSKIPSNAFRLLNERFSNCDMLNECMRRYLSLTHLRCGKMVMMVTPPVKERLVERYHLGTYKNTYFSWMNKSLKWVQFEFE